MYYLVILGILVMYLARMYYFHALNLKQVNVVRYLFLQTNQILLRFASEKLDPDPTFII